MDSVVLTLFISLSVPLLLMLGLLEKKSRLSIVFMFIGMFMCMFVSEINGLILNAYTTDNFLYVTTNTIPVTEELVKALAIVYFAFIISDDRDTLISLGMAEGIGFALLENEMYFYNAGTMDLRYTLLRVFGSGLMHGLCTAMVGVGASYVRKQKKLFYSGTLALIVMASTYHAIYNSFAQSDYEKIGYCIPIITYIPILILTIRSEKKKADIEMTTLEEKV